MLIHQIAINYYPMQRPTLVAESSQNKQEPSNQLNTVPELINPSNNYTKVQRKPPERQQSSQGITYEGRYAFVFKYHFRFLQHLSDESKMNLPFFFLKSLQKMLYRVKEHQNHTKQYIFHHGLIKLTINTVLQSRGKTWEYFIFWSGFQNDQERQSHRRQADKG